ncbi:polysaccharide biosynthesis/export family protein [Sphingomonas sp.]|uniref:polysaccharide biosynthesis/export family protein n=1 Tax=Sphingomonas sp. TaxID=28214 RepID=UPI00286E60F5|nr:polysaccharide biosynthesis/export family protein [Sphingomonas sp.]
MSKFILPAFAVMLLCGCGSSVQLDRNSTAVRVADSLPAPDSPEVAVDVSAYRIGPTDQIAISVFGAPELDREGAVDAAGNFALPLAGSIAAAGKTPQQLATDIEEKLRGRYLKDPKVAVNIKEARSQMVTVDGEVKQPGIYPVVGRMSLQQAVATAKGASAAANIGNVIVFRTVNGQKMAAMFNLKDIRSGRYEDPQIYGNDIVVVGDSATRRFLQDASMAMPLLARFVPVL